MDVKNIGTLPNSAQPVMTVDDYSSALVLCKSRAETWALHVECMAGYGFDRLQFGMTSYPSQGCLGDMSDVLILIEGEQSYIDEYIEKKIYENTPMTEWAKSYCGPMSWAEVRKSALRPKNIFSYLPLIKLGMRYGMKAGYNLSLAEVDSPKIALIGLCGKPGMTQTEVENVWQEFGADIEVLCQLFYMRISALPGHELVRPMTTRQKDCLHWYGDGKTTRDIAEIMKISPTTVEKHFLGAREALDVSTTAQALKKALLLNLI